MKGKPNPSARYAYRGPDGTLLFEVVRRPNQAKGWDRFIIWEHVAGTFESSLVYRLPDLIAAPLDEVVYWTEGEKDAEALIAHGLLATTTSDGPVPYDPRKVVRWFEGRKVVLLPDNDEAGHLYAAKIEASLRGIASSVTRLRVPVGVKDVSEWLDGGGRLSDIITGPYRVWGQLTTPTNNWRRR